ncbi:EAL domain-containing protein [Alteromonas sp. IB21]|uniref:EAL domain-containing protein n=1 Tax=Alteromonas sp. IB21 TaxID=2779369 RepID=UPI0018E7BDE7|nr:EAL domain-containing protein [Alteromonas sp. IB21]MBJ2128803.1 EAL domain-containing protein [Alteromonas sp. IB21]
MKLFSRINWGIIALLFFAFIALSVAELRVLQSDTSTLISDDTEKALASYTKAVNTTSASSQTRSVILNALAENLADSPYIASANIVDKQGNVSVRHENASTNVIPSWFALIDTTPAFNKRVALPNNDDYLVVTSDKHAVYTKFSAVVVKNAVMFVALSFLVYLLVTVLAKSALRPINDIIRKLNDMGSHNFTSPDAETKAKDFESLSITVNNLAATLASKFDDLTRQAELFKKEASKDALTGLSNRGAFERHMRALLNENATSQEKELIVVRLAQLASINSKLGMVPGDNYVKAITNILMEETKNNSSIRFVFRLSGGDFALISEPMEKPTRDLVLTNISTQCASVTPLRDGTKATWIGVTRFTGSMTMQQVMESVDSALIASMKTQSGWQLASDIAHVHSNSQWRERLNHIVSQQYADIMIQPVMDIEKNMPAYYETSGRFKDKKTNDVIPMSQLIPASERLDLIPQVDKLVAHIVFKKMEVTSQQVAINLSITSIANREFREWLVKELTLRENLCSKLFFEIEDAALIQQREYTELLCRHLMGLGCRITIEHFGDNFASLSGLRVIQPQFVKLSGRLTQGIHTNKDNQLFVSSLISIAKNLNIKVIAEMVETEAESIALTKLGVEHQQGYYFAKPALWNVY